MKLLRIFTSAMLAFGAICLVACSDDDEEDLIIEDETTVNPDEGTGDGSGDEEEPGDTEEPKTGISFANEALETVTLDFSEGATATLSIISYESWTGKPAFEEEEEAWFSISPESGEASEDEQEITVTALSANAGDIRTALLYFTTEDTGEEISVTVTQASPTEGIVLETESVELENTEGATATVTFVSYGPWTGSLSYAEGDEGEWLSASPASGEGSTSSQSLTLTAKANETGAARTATLTLTTESGTTATVSVEQKIGYPSEGFVLDETSFTLAEADQSTATVTFVSYGDWTASVDEESDWLTVSPESGNGSIEQQTLTLTAGRNYGTERVATVTLTSGNETATVTATQSASSITLAIDDFTGNLAGNFASESSFTVSYSGVYAGEEVEISTALSGADGGLSVEDYEETATATSGAAELAITGTPTSAGKLTAKITLKVNEVETVTAEKEVTVYLVYQDFGKFPWGGDFAGHASGVMPTTESEGRVTGLQWTGLEEAVRTCAYNYHATNSFIDPKNYSETFIENIGMTDWAGNYDYMHYHQVRVGGSSGAGDLQTPQLTKLPTGSNKVKVTVDMCRRRYYEGYYDDDLTNGSDIYMEVRHSNSQTVTFATITTEQVPTVTSSSMLGWHTVSGTAENVTTDDRIQISVKQDNSVLLTNFIVELIEE